MVFHIITLFPEVFGAYFRTSMMRIAQEQGSFEAICHNLCDYSSRNTRRVDDRPYGGFPGTILSPKPLYDAITKIRSLHGDLDIIHLTPRGARLTQPKLEKLAKNPKDHIVICGHYEGIDQRIVDMFSVREISIGDYILTSGELAAMVLIDGIVRLIPGVLNERSLEEETFSPGLKRKKEYPQYTRPYDFMGRKVPEVLVSGDPKKIDEWKRTTS